MHRFRSPALGLLVLALPAFLPLLAGLLGAARTVLGVETVSVSASFWPDGRVQLLLLNSLALSSAAGLLATGLALLLACALLMHHPPRWRGLLLVLLLASFCLGSVVHLMAWRALAPGSSTGPGASVLGVTVLGWRYAPLALAVVWAGLSMTERSELEAAVVTGGSRAVWRIASKRLLPLLGSACLAVVVLVFAEAEVPPLLGQHVYAEELMAQIALEPSAAAATALGWPLMAAAALAAWALARLGLAHATTAGAVATRGWIGAWRGPSRIARRSLQALALLVAGWPLLLLVLGSLSASGRWPAAAWPAVLNSVALALAAGLIACLWGWALADAALRVGPGARRLVKAALLLAMLWPSSLLGLAFVGLPWPRGFGASLPLLLAHTLRVLPFVAWLLLAQRELASPGAEWQLRLLGRCGRARWMAWRHVRGPAMVWGLVGGLLLAAGLSMAELGVTVLTVPPGFETVILRLYNLLHYGDARAVLVLALVQALSLAALLALAALGLRVLRRRPPAC